MHSQSDPPDAGTKQLAGHHGNAFDLPNLDVKKTNLLRTQTQGIKTIPIRQKSQTTRHMITSTRPDFRHASEVPTGDFRFIALDVETACNDAASILAAVNSSHHF